MFGAPNSRGQLFAADRSTSRRPVLGRKLTVAEIEDEERFLASLGMTVSWFEMTALMSGLNTRGERCLFL
jgi:hypothetical protein